MTSKKKNAFTVEGISLEPVEYKGLNKPLFAYSF
jgi:hypothetical protein